MSPSHVAEAITDVNFDDNDNGSIAGIPVGDTLVGDKNDCLLSALTYVASAVLLLVIQLRIGTEGKSINYYTYSTCYISARPRGEHIASKEAAKIAVLK